MKLVQRFCGRFRVEAFVCLFGLWLIILIVGIFVHFLRAASNRAVASNTDYETFERRLDSGINGRVWSDAPMEGVEVRRPGRAEFFLTDSWGLFATWRETPNDHLAFWKEGFRISWYGPEKLTRRRADGYLLEVPVYMQLLPERDHTSYHWQSPTPERESKRPIQACGTCHTTTYEEWGSSAHANASNNRHFQALLNGPGPRWNLREERIDGELVCGSCHSPTRLDVLTQAGPDGRRRNEADLSGVHCDYCHKIVGPAEGAVGLSHGRFGLKLLRPGKDEKQLLFGPLKDPARDDNAYSIFQHQSRYCASCHEGIVFGVPVYTTFSEWQASPAATAGVQCQDCHMKPTGKMNNMAPGHGGVERDPMTLANHRFFDGSREDMLRRCLQLSLSAKRDRGDVRVSVEVRTDGAGHSVPTGFVDRNLVLLVTATDAAGRELSVQAGPRLPAVAGKSVGGHPGRLYAKQLKDFDGHSPAPFWRADPDVTDTRLEPGKPDSAEWRFPASATQIRVRVWHRRFWPEVAEMKGWTDNETLLLERTEQVN
ncbi:MAG: multiheme c-type cytochrome [Gemmataceae bacterium]